MVTRSPRVIDLSLVFKPIITRARSGREESKSNGGGGGGGGGIVTGP